MSANCLVETGIGIHRSALVIVSGSTMYRVFRVTYCVLRIAYSPKGHPKHNIIYVIFNDTVQDNISRGLAETMIMA